MHPRERGQKLVDALLCGRDDDVVKLLTDKVDFTIENRGDNAIHLAARRGNVEVIKLMKKWGADLQQKNVHGNVPMHYAAKGGFVDLVMYLKENGAKLSIRNEAGESPLHEAVKTQTMDVIEMLVDIGMSTNRKNKKDGDTPLHTALKYGAVEAMEGLLIKGAQASEANDAKKRPEDVAKTAAIKECLRMYSTMLIAMSSGYIKAKGMKITHLDVSKPLKVDRVGVIIESIDIPKEFRTGFYCRREKTENATVTLQKYHEESVLSDVFHIRIFEVNRDCKTKIYLPLYKAPSEKEQMVIRFIYNDQEDMPVDEFETQNKVDYCMLETTLVPETTCICIVYARARIEKSKITEDGVMITSEMEKDFSLDVPAGSFEGETVLSLKVFETNTFDYVESEELAETAIGGARSSYNEDNHENTTDEISPSTGREIAREASKIKDDHVSNPAPKPNTPSLLTDVYQIEVSGQQPKKDITIQIPLCKGMHTEEEISIVRADEDKLNEVNAIEVLQTKPRIVGCNLVFEVSHLSIYVASWKKKVASNEDKLEIQRQILSARDKRKPAALFALVRKVEDRKHVLLVECVVASKSKEKRKKWIETDGYEEQNPPEAASIMMTPGDIYCVDIVGNAKLEDRDDATERKIQFSLCRSSWQPYSVVLDKNIYSDNPEKAHAYVIISKKSDTGMVEAARLRIKLKAPAPPPQKQSVTGQKKLQNIGKPGPGKIPNELSAVEVLQQIYSTPLTIGNPLNRNKVKKQQNLLGKQQKTPRKK